MVELKGNVLVLSFPEVHRRAVLKLEFQRTLRIPDDDRDYPLPPGLGRFPLRQVDAFTDTVPEEWLAHGGVLLPMYQAEAMWLYFKSDYPFAVQVATGKVSAITGTEQADGLHRDPQDYLVTPPQLWLEGYCDEKGIGRQFVAMPLGTGYGAAEQLTGRAEHGGLQIVVHPMRPEAAERLVRQRRQIDMPGIKFSRARAPSAGAPGLAPGGRMRQPIYQDPHDSAAWDLGHRGRCFVHLVNSLQWRSITGQNPPTDPPTAESYSIAELPWFDCYDGDARALAESPLPQNASIETPVVM